MVANCEQIRREISNYIDAEIDDTVMDDGEIDDSLRSTMEEHFRACAGCASVLAGMRNVVQLYGDERMLEVPAGFSRRLEKRLSKNVVERRRRWSNWSAWLMPVAALALIAGSLKLISASTFWRPPKSLLAEPGHDIPPDMQVLVTLQSKVFHVAGCPFIHNKATARTITAREAMQQGYVPCTRCLRAYLKTSMTHKPGTQVADATGGIDDGEGKDEDENEDRDRLQLPAQ